MKKLIILVLIAIIGHSVFSQPALKTFGVQINVTELDKAIDFYINILGFQIETADNEKRFVVLKPITGNEKILLNKVSYLLPVGENEARATLTLQVNNLDSIVAMLKSKGVDFGNYQKRKEGVGYAMYVDDPFGTRLSLMHETVVDNPHFAEPRIYNYGFYISDMDKGLQFYSTLLGFPLLTKTYLPLDAPLNNPDKSFGFMLHTRNGIQAIHYNEAANEHLLIVFCTKNIDQAVAELKSKGVRMAVSQVKQGAFGKTVSFYDPFGYISLLVETKE